MRGLIVLTVIVQVGCLTKTLQAPPLPDPDKPVHFLIPIGARNQDYVCAETIGSLPNECRTIQAFRVWILDARAN